MNEVIQETNTNKYLYDQMIASFTEQKQSDLFFLDFNITAKINWEF